MEREETSVGDVIADAVVKPGKTVRIRRLVYNTVNNRCIKVPEFFTSVSFVVDRFEASYNDDEKPKEVREAEIVLVLEEIVALMEELLE
jgi:hypothetical protein